MVDTEPGKHALAYIMKSGPTKLSPQEAITVRDFLIAQILLDNGQRPGPLETAHLLDFKRVQAKEDCKHETSKADPAPLTISVNLTTNIETYIANRGILANDDEDTIQPWDHWEVSHRVVVQSHWKAHLIYKVLQNALIKLAS